MLNNPTKLKYNRLKLYDAPKYGVSDSLSQVFREGSADVSAWFVELGDARHYVATLVGISGVLTIWDLETGKVCP